MTWRSVFPSRASTASSTTRSIIRATRSTRRPALPRPRFCSKRAGVTATVETPLDVLLQGSTLTWGLDFVHDNTFQQLENGWDVISPMKQNSVAGFAQLQVPVTD